MGGSPRTEQQLCLFDAAPVHKLHRVTDPDTSLLAAIATTQSGRRETHKRILLDAVVRWPGSTSAELASWVGLERHEAARRLADLRNDGAVRQGAKRACLLCGNVCVTWEVGP